jgi:hypothetical protein
LKNKNYFFFISLILFTSMLIHNSLFVRAESQPLVYNCVDSDNINYDIKGTVTITKDGSIIDQKTDQCILNDNTANLIEYYCEYPNQKFVSLKYFSCPTGCSDGVCNPEVYNSDNSNSVSRSPLSNNPWMALFLVLMLIALFVLFFAKKTNKLKKQKR